MSVRSTAMSGVSRGASSARTEFLTLALGALGIVYGDIGTSPLYAIKECFHPEFGVAPTFENVYGILSLVFWSLTLVVSFKYLIFILKADNRHEGGIMALLALVFHKLSDGTHKKAVLVILGLFGASLLYGDGVITPAISVLSAVEGLAVGNPDLETWVVPLTVGILIALFSVQKRGTASIGAIFGPACFLWFATLIATGLPAILQHPEILTAMSPLHAIQFFQDNGLHGALVLGAVVLCITGAEALYADMGHFGKGPIRLSWFGLVFPALLINYFGQGALILEKGLGVLKNPFYGLVDGWLRYPLVAIATLAAVIASQALISGAYSLTQQAVQLGFLPRMTIMHTSRQTEGQIYIPKVNLFLMLGTLALVVALQSSSNLAAAYGIATTGAMVITAILFFAHVRINWNWPLWTAVPMTLLFLFVDLSFFSANLHKIPDGGWFPILVAFLSLALMTTWKRGRKFVSATMFSISQPMDHFLMKLNKENPPRVDGTAVFMTLTRDIAPSVLLHHYTHNQVLHRKVVLLSIVTDHVPEIPSLERVRVTELEQGFYKVVARYGYMQTPDISEILALCEGQGLQIDHENLSFYLGRESFVTTGDSGMAGWRKRLFVFLSRNARPASEFYRLPPENVIEIGSQIRI